MYYYVAVQTPTGERGGKREEMPTMQHPRNATGGVDSGGGVGERESHEAGTNQSPTNQLQLSRKGSHRSTHIEAGTTERRDEVLGSRTKVSLGKQAAHSPTHLNPEP